MLCYQQQEAHFSGFRVDIVQHPSIPMLQPSLREGSGYRGDICGNFKLKKLLWTGAESPFCYCSESVLSNT